MSDSSIISISEDESPRTSRSASPDSPPAKKALIIPAFTAVNQPKIRRCKECNVFLQNVEIFDKHEFKIKYPNWQSEFGGFALDGMKIEGSNELENYLLEDFCLFDEEDHLIHLDSNFLKKNDKLVKKIYFSGVVSPFVNDQLKVPIIRGGPIQIWWITGYEKDEPMQIAITTSHGQFYFQSPSKEFKKFFLEDKSKVLKMVYTCLKENQDLTYEDLLEVMVTKATEFELEDFSQQTLLSSGNFIINQIESYEREAEEDEEVVLDTEAFKELKRLTKSQGNFGQSNQRKKRAERRQNFEPNFDDYNYSDYSDSDYEAGGSSRRRQRGTGQVKRPKKQLQATHAITTKLVSHFFGSVFGTEIKDVRKTGCGVCKSCKKVDCSKCANCKMKKKFGGYRDDDTVVCYQRECDEKVIKIDDDDEPMNFVRKREKSTIIEFGPKNGKIGDQTYYDWVRIDGNKYEIGDFGMTFPNDATSSRPICQILSITKNQQNGQRNAHVRWFVYGHETILGEIADPNELFATKDCENIPLHILMTNVMVEHFQVPDNWNMLGGSEESIQTPTTHRSRSGENDFYWFRSLYLPEQGRFERLPRYVLEFDETGQGCASCEFFSNEFKKYSPKLFAGGDSFELVNEEYAIGDAVMLRPNSFKLPNSQKRLQGNFEKKNPKEYPEHYRKTRRKGGKIKGDTIGLADPFDIGIITDVIQSWQWDDFEKAKVEKVQIEVRQLYRPENTQEDWKKFVGKHDICQLFWTDKFVIVDAILIEKKCYVLPEHKIVEEHPFLWWQKGQYRFFYSSMYDPDLNEFTTELSEAASDYVPPSDIIDFNQDIKALDTMDVFAGCGGLSIGLEQSGVAQVKWGIEWEPSAAEAFQKNHPDAFVTNRDVNIVLKEVMDSEDSDIQPEGVPRKGEVELLCGGPPCQGFSVMNCFTESDASRFKNSLISSYLSYCDYYRPKFFILENVKMFAAFNKGQVLRLCMGALVRMGYQCQFGVLQAGHYGVPQDRKRAILLAAAPNVKMPKFPQPLHTFKEYSLNVNMDGKSFDVRSEGWRTASAPYRCVTVRDGISDLPLNPDHMFNSNSDKNEVNYRCEPKGSFQKMARWNSKTGEFRQSIEDHVSKKLSTLVMERLKYIPKTFGADWRDLPNISVNLPDGTTTHALRYPYNTKRDGKVRPAVCHCLTGPKQACYEEDRQENTLVPYALSHTGSRHNDWSGLYGRVHYESYFSTIICNVHPDSKQGRVLHPTEPRIVSIRECARAQGFRDSDQFYGSVQDKYRQIGNAVPPPIGRALGISILEAYDNRK